MCKCVNCVLVSYYQLSALSSEIVWVARHNRPVGYAELQGQVTKNTVNIQIGPG